jgi:hypothetical protein
MKKLLVILIALVVVAAAAAVFLLGSIGEIVKGVVERVGSDATQAPVTLETVDLSVTAGSGELRNLVVGNPAGFESEHAMKLGLVRVTLDTATINADPVIVKEVVVDGPEVIYEVGTGGTNIGAIQENVEAYARRLGGGGGGDAPAPDGEEGRKVIIENLYIRNVKVTVAATFLGGKGAGATIPEIHLRDVGKAEGGATPGEVAAEFLDALLDGVVKAVTDLDIDGLKKQGEGLLENAGKALKGIFGGDDD